MWGTAVFRRRWRGSLVPSERFTGLAAVLDAVRSDPGITQPALTDRVGLGRSVVAQRVGELESAGLVAPDGLGPSTGGRAPRRLRMRGEAGYVLGVDIATNELLVGLADLAGNLLETRHEETDVSDGPEVIISVVERLGDELLDATGARDNLWAVGLGMPGPVAYEDGVASAMPTMPDWDRFPTRARLAARWAAPVWMDNRVNLSALGERRVNPLAAASRHTIYLGGGEALGAAVVVDGQIYRGARGLAVRQRRMPRGGGRPIGPGPRRSPPRGNRPESRPRGSPAGDRHPSTDGHHGGRRQVGPGRAGPAPAQCAADRHHPRHPGQRVQSRPGGPRWWSRP